MEFSCLSTGKPALFSEHVYGAAWLARGASLRDGKVAGLHLRVAPLRICEDFIEGNRSVPLVIS
ncbi:hypothetical protein C0Z19_22605 [Trinickia soli]|uniref:Uncharacterized protein n=1 Tax=Trinickia soli TaxID=380675 RepID=A0A2N7VNF9_9BURK|nr:hypothetical protein C0Z19_22605 [Trinickia soli]